LGDEVRAIFESMKAAVRAGARPADLGRSLANAAAETEDKDPALYSAIQASVKLTQ
jgi:hypothetical protein